MASISDQNSDEILISRTKDAIRLCERRRSACFVGFLDERQKAVIEDLIGGQDLNACFFGGYADSERTVFGVFPAGDEQDISLFPLIAVAFSYRAAADISHRDVLGALLSAGIKRETVGDILCEKGRAVVFLRKEVLPFAAEQIDRIGREGVECQYPYVGELPVVHEFRQLRDTVASLRLDAVLKICLGASREDAAKKIAAGLVSLNHRPCSSPSQAVRENDLLSVRGAGRFRIKEVGPQTKKGRLFIVVDQYV